MAETSLIPIAWSVGAGPRSRTDYSALPVCYSSSDLRRVADRHRATGSLSASRRSATTAPRCILEQILDLRRWGRRRETVRQDGRRPPRGSVREQGEELTRRGIRWQVVPASALSSARRRSWGGVHGTRSLAESLIITRLEGRTPDGTG